MKVARRARSGMVRGRRVLANRRLDYPETPVVFVNYWDPSLIGWFPSVWSNVPLRSFRG